MMPLLLLMMDDDEKKVNGEPSGACLYRCSNNQRSAIASD